MKDKKENYLNVPFSNIIKEGLTALVEASDFLIKKEQNTIEKYLEQKSPELDKLILNLEESGVGRYVAGEVRLLLDEDDGFHLEGDFYFKDSNENWIKKSVIGKSMKLNWALLPDEQEKMRVGKKLTFEYDHP